MKKLYVLRHAKSSRDFPGLEDIDRPLNSRGKKDAPRMGRNLKKKKVRPQLILSSPALRAFETAKLVAHALAYPAVKIKKKRAIYEANVWALLRLARTTAGSVDSLMIVGHNPGITGLANYLSNAGIENMPTCAVVGIEFRIDSWRSLVRHRGTVIFFKYPKK